MCERRIDDRSWADADRPHAQPNARRAATKRTRAQRPGGRDPAGANAHGVRRPDGLRNHDRLATAATTRAKSTILGPHRDATLSSTVTTRPRRTAETSCQPGLSPAVAAVWPQQTEPASTTMSGLA